MNRRNFLVLSTTAVALHPFRALVGARTAQPQAAPPAPKFESIRRNVNYFSLRGGTIGWVSNSGGLVTVDTQYPDTAKIFLEGLKERAGDRKIDVAFNTHHHGDHVGGNGAFKAAAKRLVAHQRVPELQKMVAAQPPANPSNPPPAPVFPDATFDKTWSETFGDETVTAKHYGPGHTGGDAIIIFERAQVVHMGDLYFNELHPRVDRPGGASIQNWIRTIRTVAKEMPGDTIYIAGHARPGLPVTTGRKELLRLADYFDAVLTHVRGAVAKKQTRDEIVKLEALPGFETYAGSGAILSLAGVLGNAYDELTTAP
jgi:glyoxylase-like metal-dependent hydrolase (beta-lactamase superfamily II)